jgi:hypothetical protein
LIAAAGQVKTFALAIMPSSPSSPLVSDIAAALDWWRAAGVDAAYSDDPRTWLKAPAQTDVPEIRPAPAPDTPPAPPRRILGGDRATWPQDIPAFRQWWLTEPSLDEGGLAPRVAPRGDARAKLMVLVEMPDEGDRDSLLSGRAGAMLDSFLDAAGVPSSIVYRAAVLPRHTPMADWSMLSAEGIGALLAHHVSLARPERLLAFGRNIPPLCGHDPAQGAQNLRSFNHEGGRVPSLYEVGLDRLLEKPGLRSRFWQRWLDWTDGQTWDNGQG